MKCHWLGLYCHVELIQTPGGLRWCVWAAGLTDEEVIIQALIFTVIGNNNMASSVALAAYNLAVHPQLQNKLQAEIDRTFPGKVAQRFILSRYQGGEQQRGNKRCDHP